MASSKELLAAFFKLYEETHEVGNCGDCPVLDSDDDCPALYVDDCGEIVGSNDTLCREQILKCYMEESK